MTEGAPGGRSNIRPMHPLEHRQHHMENGDLSRWARLPRKGSKVPPEVGGLGWLGIIPDITGILSGRIRTDTFDNFSNDLMGIPSQEDREKALEDEQRRLNPKWKRGDPIMI